MAHDLSRLLHEQLADRCKLGSMPPAIEQRRSNLAFQLAYLLAKRGLAKIQQPRCLSKIQPFRKQYKRSEAVNFHNHRLSRSSKDTIGQMKGLSVTLLLLR